MRISSALICLFFLHQAFSQQNPVGIFQYNSDIGDPKLEGSVQYDPSDQSYALKGSGYNIWFNRDEFRYAYNRIGGDFILTANFEFTGEGTDPHRKMGWMVRESTDESSPHASAVIHGDGLTVLQWRALRGAYMRNPQDEIFAPKNNYQILQVERSGKLFIMRAAHSGEPLQEIGRQTLEYMPDTVLAGLFISAHNPDIYEEAKVWNVRIDKPASEDYNPSVEGFLGCRMEIMNVFDGKRKVIFEKSDRFEAPNWMPDGKKLLFNMAGSLYTIPITGGNPEKFNTGNVNRNNNDHGISFDGKMIAISSQRDGMPGGGSTIYVLPITGGTPEMVTHQTPSYWHGWAPNNKEIIYVAQRGQTSRFNIYRNSIKGGNEVALTNTKPGVHVDGCEYTPDGKYIYYNGSHSGTMQIWRMKPDGTGGEQITFDEHNDWFPHVSPDGKWIVYISFPHDIPINTHPSYKRVSLKLLPTEGGSPRTIAYLYGGQGTINVPSWSPDSKHIAFVSNSGK